MIRLVIATNVLVSAFASPDRSVSRVAAAGGELENDRSLIFAEYEDVLRRAQFKRWSEEIEQTLETMGRISLWVRPQTKVTACADADDHAFLA